MSDPLRFCLVASCASLQRKPPRTVAKPELGPAGGSDYEQVEHVGQIGPHPDSAQPEISRLKQIQEGGRKCLCNTRASLTLNSWLLVVEVFAG